MRLKFASFMNFDFYIIHLYCFVCFVFSEVFKLLVVVTPFRVCGGFESRSKPTDFTTAKIKGAELFNNLFIIIEYVTTTNC